MNNTEYLFKDTNKDVYLLNNDTTEYVDCKCCGQLFVSMDALRTHLDTRYDHPSFEQYCQMFQLKGHFKGDSAKPYCVYVLCDPRRVEPKSEGYYSTSVGIIKFDHTPYFVGYGEMGELNYTSIVKENMMNRVTEILALEDKKPIIYIIKDHLDSCGVSNILNTLYDALGFTTDRHRIGYLTNEEEIQTESRTIRVEDGPIKEEQKSEFISPDSDRRHPTDPLGTYWLITNIVSNTRFISSDLKYDCAVMNMDYTKMIEVAGKKGYSYCDLTCVKVDPDTIINQ